MAKPGAKPENTYGQQLNTSSLGGQRVGGGGKVERQISCEHNDLDSDRFAGLTVTPENCPGADSLPRGN